MGAQHTPGPWIAHLDPEKGWLVVGVCADVQPADARLIAAAPELLGALKAAIPVLMAMERFIGKESVAETCGGQDVLGLANRAIAKTEGR